jgi:N-acylneuraminate cytidylyltransferase
VFTDNKVFVTDDGRETVRCDRADGLAIDLLRRYCVKQSVAIDIFIVSTEHNPVVTARAEKLRLEAKQSVGNKMSFITEHFKKYRSMDTNPFVGLVYLGNDLNDLHVIERAGFSVVPGDAHELVKCKASAVLYQKGGEGFVRAAVERLLDLSHMTLEEINELVCNR